MFLDDCCLLGSYSVDFFNLITYLAMGEVDLRRKKNFIVLGIIVIVCLGIGGEKYMDQKRLQDEMVTVVKQNSSLIKDELKTFDSFNKIKTISIKYDTIEESPLGGMLFQGFVNGDETLSFNGGLQKDGETIETTNTAPKKKLLSFLEKRE